MSVTTYFTDIRTPFGRFRGNGNWAVMSKDKSTRGANDCGWDKRKREKVLNLAKHLWVLKIKTKPFQAPSRKKAYFKFEGHWFPTEQIIHVCSAVGVEKAAMFIGPTSKTPTFMAIGSAGRGLVAAMDEHYIAHLGGDAAAGKIKFGAEE